MNLMGSKTLETDRLTLRATEENDLKKLWSILCIPEVNKYYLTCKLSYNWEDEIKYQYKKLEHAKDLNLFQWSIVIKDTNECIGKISVQEGNSNNLNYRDIGWFINPKYQGKGLATEAASKILDYMFNVVEIESIDTSAAIVNESSWKLMEKLGFIRNIDENTWHKYTFVNKPIECYSYHIDKKLFINKSQEHNRQK